METYDIVPVGVLVGDLHSIEAAPKNYTESRHVGTIEVFSRYAEALDGIEAGQTVVVLFWLHRAARDILRVHPRGDRSRPKKGVFALRSPARPNPIAVSELQVLAVDGCRLTVRGVDVLDGTPVIDIKKKI
ncbi:MAG: tRNA (N6-threonylcarbamoyladenosine(37)-N6)-methyltransferase TrmO [Thermodesulfobacteriota bacterium]